MYLSDIMDRETITMAVYVKVAAIRRKRISAANYTRR